MSTTRPARWLRRALCAALACLALASCTDIATMPAGTGSGGQSLAELVDSGLSMQAERGTGELEIVRKSPGATRPSGLAKDSWTVFVYLCGSNLESQGGAATKDLQEMLKANGNPNVRFVVETGGAKSWRNDTVSPRKLGRYVVQNGTLTDAGSVTAAAMGDAQTLADFLAWGVRSYPADHMGLILWDHGGGSISGVCFDERNDNDSLSLRELDAALSATFDAMWEKFAFVGFDACLMSTLETANILATYADYMVASQESEPATGWEYSSIGQYLAQHPSCDGNQLGRELCNSYLDSVDRKSKGFATLSVVDLSQIDQLMQDFYRFSQEMFASGENQHTMAAMSRGVQKASNYGCNNRREGYTNMVDLGGLVDACADVTPSAADVKRTLHKAVTYQIRGTYHADATGLSTYYPLRVNTARELAIFETVAVNPSYLQYVDRVAHGATYNGGDPYQQYSGDTFFEDAIWNWLLGNTQEVEQQAEDHWEYVDDHSEESTQISFAAPPQIDHNGTFWFQLDEAGIDHTSMISGLVYEVSEDGRDLIALGETCDVVVNWGNGEVADAFNGGWLSLPDGQNLNLAVEDATEDYIVYTSSITLNGRECFLRLRQRTDDGSVQVLGAWQGLSATGAVDRGVTKVRSGDTIVPRYQAFSTDGKLTESTYEGSPYQVGTKGLTVEYSYLPAGTYVYGFCITDSFGDTFFTDNVQFDIDEDGTITF